MFKKIKKHFNKILIVCLTLISSIAIFSSINKTYAYESTQFTYTINTNNYTFETINNINGIKWQSGSSYDLYIYPSNSQNIGVGQSYILINYYLLNYSYQFTYSNSQKTLIVRNLENVNMLTGGNTTYGFKPYNIDTTNLKFTMVIPLASTSNYSNGIYLRLNGSDILFLVNIDIVPYTDIGLQQYYDTYYGNIEENYTQLQSDYSDLQDEYDSLNDNYNELNEQYEDLNNDLEDLQAEYDDLQIDYTNLQNNYDSLDDSLSHNVINELVGNNYFTKSNIQLLQNEDTFSHHDNIFDNPFGATTPIYAMISNYIDNKTLYIGSALQWVSNNNFYNNANYNSDYFTWINLVPFYNYSSSMINENGVSRWDTNSSVKPLCKYVDITIVSSRDILIEVVIQDSLNSFIYQTIERDSTTGNYEIKFDNNDERVFGPIHLQCKLSNGVYYTADRIISNTGNITDNQYELGFQNGSVSSQATINALNNDIRDLNEQITTANLTIDSLKEQISSISSDYNLNNLIWAIGGTPFESFKQIWNVDFFGVNIAEIVTGFLTALIALYVIKKFFK